MHFLFVESDGATRATRAAALAAQGWTVHQVDSVSAALHGLASLSQVDVLITEAIAASGPTGFDLFTEVQKTHPAARVLYTTRYDLTGFDEAIDGWPTLADAPYTEADLVAAASALIASPARQPRQYSPMDEFPILVPGTILDEDYQILERLAADPQTESYRAMQARVGREVGVVLLKPSVMGDPDVLEKFKARERVKASLTHPRIAPLFEAGQHQGLHYYTREMPRGRSIDQMLASGETLSERGLAEALYGIAEAMDYATQRDCDHRDMLGRDVFIAEDHQASMVNIFRPVSEHRRDQIADVASFLTLMQPLAKEGRAQRQLQALREGQHNWAGLLHELEDIRDAMNERSIMRRIDEQDGAAVTVVRRVPLWAWAAGIAALACGVIVTTVSTQNGTATIPAGSEEMVEIPAGAFVYQSGDHRTLPTFWISKHEVTIGQYAAFLEALDTGSATAFDHPDQPRTKKSHLPKGWAEYYVAAQSGSTYNNQTISLNTPVSQVDWWDAYAYAKWSGQRLPTEEEWEKAARGPDGFPYPWGQKARPDAANLGLDYDPSGKNGGKKDGYNLWAPEDRKIEDVSPYGVCDMAGNVQEWTAAEHTGEPWPEHPQYPDVRAPVVRGGHFALNNDKDLLTNRYFPESANEATLARGFRTASDSPPAE